MRHIHLARSQKYKMVRSPARMTSDSSKWCPHNAAVLSECDLRLGSWLLRLASNVIIECMTEGITPGIVQDKDQAPRPVNWAVFCGWWCDCHASSSSGCMAVTYPLLKDRLVYRTRCVILVACVLPLTSFCMVHPELREYRTL